jgi:hypothetical protein
VSTPAAVIASTNASSNESAVSRPSSESVTATNGSRRKAGNGGKYVYCLPSWVKPSILRMRKGISSLPCSIERACAS